jgi:hypothetical protein
MLPGSLQGVRYHSHHRPFRAVSESSEPPPRSLKSLVGPEVIIMTADSDKEGESAPGTPLATDGARALAAAVTQIELALLEAHTPVEQLGLLTERMANALGSLRAARASDHGSSPQSAHAGDEKSSIAQLQADLYDSIQQLQFYDRMVQHLSHVQDYLSCVANQLASAAESGATADTWDGLRARLRARLISDAQRELLDLVLPPPAGTPSAQETALTERACQGSVELF